jgi:CBS domain containing-hemolysin-like protein
MPKETMMVTHTELLLIGLLFVFIALNGLFVAAEYSLIRLRRSRVAEMNQQKIYGAKTIQSLQQTMDRSVAGAQLGITVCGLAVGGVGQGPIRDVLQAIVNLVGHFWPWFDSWHVPVFVGIVVSFVLLTMMHVIIGEQVPKLLALRNPEKLALRLALPFFIFCRTAAPLLTVINGVTSLILRLVGIPQKGHGQDSPSVDELQILIEESRKAGKLAADETNLLSKVLELRGLHVRDVMMPLSLVDGISEDMPLVEALEIVSQTRHSRLPVFRAGRQTVVGILNSRELLDLFKKKLRIELKISTNPTPLVSGLEPIGKLSAFIRKPYFVCEDMLASDLLAEFGKRHMQLAIVTDSAHPTEVVGLITQEDLLEQLVGEIVDEWDKPIVGIAKLDGVNCYRVDAELTLYELHKVIDVRLMSDSDSFTVGAVVAENLLSQSTPGAAPKVGDSVDLVEFRFTVSAIAGGAISSLDICPVPPSPAQGETDVDKPEWKD